MDGGSAVVGREGPGWERPARRLRTIVLVDFWSLNRPAFVLSWLLSRAYLLTTSSAINPRGLRLEA